MNNKLQEFEKYIPAMLVLSLLVLTLLAVALSIKALKKPTASISSASQEFFSDKIVLNRTDEGLSLTCVK